MCKSESNCVHKLAMIQTSRQVNKYNLRFELVILPYVLKTMNRDPSTRAFPNLTVNRNK